MGTEELPKFDMTLQWRIRKDTKPRRELNFQKNKTALPAITKGNSQVLQELYTENSTSADHSVTRAYVGFGTSRMK